MATIKRNHSETSTPPPPPSLASRAHTSGVLQPELDTVAFMDEKEIEKLINSVVNDNLKSQAGWSFGQGPGQPLSEPNKSGKTREKGGKGGQSSSSVNKSPPTDKSLSSQIAKEDYCRKWWEQSLRQLVRSQIHWSSNQFN